MPPHQGRPREGFSADRLLNLIRKTALNPKLLLPLILFARYTKRGGELSATHPAAVRRLQALLLIAIARAANSWYSDKVRNNWVEDKYFWPKEIALITGGADGIGGRIVKLLEERGVTVVVLDVQPMSFAVSAKVHYYHCDIRLPENVAAVAKKIKAEVGHPTVLINNAGVIRGKPVLEATPAEVRQTFEVNTLSHYYIVQNFLPKIVERNHGMVVTVSSFCANSPVPNMVDYSASQAAVLAFHDGLTAELTARYKAGKVRTILVQTGYTKTSLFAGYRQGSAFTMPALEPDTVADAVLKQMLTTRSAKLALPKFGSFLSTWRLLPRPDWLTLPARAKATSHMADFRGRQVVEDADALYAQDGSRRTQHLTSESTVLIA